MASDREKTHLGLRPEKLQERLAKLGGRARDPRRRRQTDIEVKEAKDSVGAGRSLRCTQPCAGRGGRGRGILAWGRLLAAAAGVPRKP